MLALPFKSQAQITNKASADTEFHARDQISQQNNPDTSQYLLSTDCRFSCTQVAIVVMSRIRVDNRTLNSTRKI